MRCPFCSTLQDKVVDSRESRAGEVIRRRRECLNCSRRFTSYERIEEIPFRVTKRDGRREPFDRKKLLSGLLKACEKRPVSVPSMEKLVEDLEGQLHEREDREVTTQEIGGYVMEKLKDLDKVAYVRFASVYRKFEDIDEFMDELKNLLGQRS